MVNGFGCMEVIDYFESSSFVEEGVEIRLEWVEEYVGGEGLEIMSLEYIF